jgi:hypothetical protein
MAIKQRERPVIEYIVEKEALENTLGEIIPKELRETSFRNGLDNWLRGRLAIFRGLPLEQYKDRAETIEQDARETKTGPFKPKSQTEKKPNEKSGSSKTSPPKQSTSDKSDKSSQDAKSKKQKPSKEQLKKEDIVLVVMNRDI